MSTQILRPTTTKRQKGEWVLQGSWGKRKYPPMSTNSFRRELHRELIDSGVLPADSPSPTNRYHKHITINLMHSSWIEGRWVLDEDFAARLKKLRGEAGLTQEQLAEKSGLDVGTIRQLEQGTRTNPTWQTVCALAGGLGTTVMAFVGTGGWHPDDN